LYYKAKTFTYSNIPCKFYIEHIFSIQNLKRVPHHTKTSVPFQLNIFEKNPKIQRHLHYVFTIILNWYSLTSFFSSRKTFPFLPNLNPTCIFCKFQWIVLRQLYDICWRKLVIRLGPWVQAQGPIKGPL